MPNERKPYPGVGCMVFLTGVTLGVLLMGEFQDRHKPVPLQDQLAPRCLGESVGYDSYLGFDGKGYACLIIERKTGKTKKFLLALPTNEGEGHD